jgi:hypothetical protein
VNSIRLVRPGFSLSASVKLFIYAGATFSDAVFDQTVGTTFRHTTFNQSIRAAFSDNRVNRGSGESVNCKNRESDAEEDLAFHDGVLRGVVVGSGADVTPRIFYENFIEVMVTIDAGNDPLVVGSSAQPEQRGYAGPLELSRLSRGLRRSAISSPVLSTCRAEKRFYTASARSGQPLPNTTFTTFN